MAQITRNPLKNLVASPKFLAMGAVAFVMVALPLHADTYLPQELSKLESQLQIGEEAETKQAGKALKQIYSNQQGCADRGASANLDGSPGCRGGSASAELELPVPQSFVTVRPLSNKIRVAASVPDRSCMIQHFKNEQPYANVASNVSDISRVPLASNGVYARPVVYQPVVFSQSMNAPINSVSNFVHKAAYDLGQVMSSMPIEIPGGGQGNNQAGICESNEDGKPACKGIQANSQTIAQGLANMEFEGGGVTAGPGGQPGAWVRPKSSERSLGNPNQENPNQEVNQRKPTNDQDPQNQDGCGNDAALNYNCGGG